jgi:hypothetical protein
MDRCRTLKRRIRWLLAFFVTGVILSGLTAVPLEWEAELLGRLFSIPPEGLARYTDWRPPMGRHGP